MKAHAPSPVLWFLLIRAKYVKLIVMEGLRHELRQRHGQQ
jgi:hypothetical protein